MGKSSKRHRNKKSPPKGGAEATTRPLGDSNTNGNISASDDPRVDILRELSKGLLSETQMANIENAVALLDTPGIGNPESIRMAKEHGRGWDRSVPIGAQVTIVNLKARKDLNGEIAQVISHLRDEGRIGVRVLSSGKEVAIKPVHAELCSESDVPPLKFNFK